MDAKLQQQSPQKAQTNKPNLTGIPTQMKLDFEQRSGLSFDDVRVHYNSDKPAQLQALAYTQGTQVYVGPGQERHLPHELGHVVQQKHGMVHPTKFVNGFAINDSPALENMADSTFSRAYSIKKSREYQIGSHLSNVIQTAPPRKRKSLRPPKLTQAEIDNYTDIINATKQKNKQSKKPRKAPKTKKTQVTHPFLKKRYYTMSSYRFTPLKKRGNNLPSKQSQGPHTVAHIYYGQLMTTKLWQEVYHNLIEPNTQEVVKAIIANELGPNHLSMFPRYDEYIQRYEQLYKELDAAMKSGFPAFDQDIGEKMMEIIEMHPYSCYGWNRENKNASSSEIGGKGEGYLDIGGDPTDLIKIAYDIHSNFVDMDSFENYLNQRFYFIDENIRNSIIRKRISERKDTIVYEYTTAANIVADNLVRFSLPLDNFVSIIKTFKIENPSHMKALNDAFIKLGLSSFAPDPSPALKTIVDYYNLYDIPEIKAQKTLEDILSFAYNGDQSRMFAGKGALVPRVGKFYFPGFFTEEGFFLEPDPISNTQG